MKKLIYPFFIAALIGFSTTQVFSEIMKPEKLWELKRLGGAYLSPDGDFLMAHVNFPDIEKNETKTNIMILELKNGEITWLDSEHNNWGGAWAPDSETIYFLSDKEETFSIFSVNIENPDEPELELSLERDISALGISPDGARLSFAYDVKLEKTVGEKYPDLKSADAKIYTDLPARHWDHWSDEYYRHVFIYDIETEDTLDLMPGEKFDAPDKPFGGPGEIAWSPGGEELAYTCKKVSDYELSTNTSVFVYNIETGKTKNITDGMPGYDLEPLYSPDGKYIAFHSQERAGYESDKIRLMLYNRDSLEIRDLTKSFPQWVGNYTWAPDSKSLYFSSTDTGRAEIFNIDLTGKWKIVAGGIYNRGDRFLEVSPGGGKLYMSRRNFNRAAEAFEWSLKNAEETQITNLNDEVFENIDNVIIDERWFKTEDGKKVHSWIVYPPDFSPDKKYPMITYCQGGPQQPVNQHFSYGWNFLTFASQGYIVLAPNRRGCPGFGQAWVDAIAKDYAGEPMRDILTCTDEMKKEPFIDSNKLSAIGASAGGYAVFWLAGNHNKRFKAFVSHCGMFNMLSKYGATEELWFPNWDNGGPYWHFENLDYYWNVTPHMHAHKWDTPILIITGMRDFRVPYTQSLEAFTAAQSMGVPSKLIVYPNENHWILNPQEKVLWYREVFDFLETHAK